MITLAVIRAPFDEACETLRADAKERATWIRALMDHPAMTSGKSVVSDVAEMKANIMLAYRHIEDAAARLGKAMRAFQGGDSFYDR